jgi:hypothetical protein
VALRLTAVDGVDVEGTPEDECRLAPSDLLTARVYADDAAWFGTFLVRGSRPRASGPALVALRVGDALRVTSERWAERAPVDFPALLRVEPGRDAPIRGTATDVSLTGVGIFVWDDDPLPGERVGVTLAGEGGGAIAFRGRVVRCARVGHGSLLGVEILGISADDHRRLAQLIARREPGL